MATSSAKSFSIANKSLKLTTEEEIKPHVQPLAESSDYEEVHLNGNTLGVPASQYLASLLRRQKSLRVANLADIFTARLLDEIPQALSALLTALLECHELHTVDLSDNAFGLNTVQPLQAFLSAHTPLQHLILNNNGLGPKAGKLIGESLSELAQKKAVARKEGRKVPELETIVCGRNRLENGSMAAWADAYARLGKVKSVKMTQNGIRQEGIAELLSRGLSQCADLEVLDLQDNTFTEPGSRALAAALPKWPSLIELGVGDCLLRAKGMKLVAKALAKKNNAGIRTLRLQGNEINAKAVHELVVAVKKGSLPKLQRVELNSNEFSEEDPSVEFLRMHLDEKREEAGGEEDDEIWGLDELDDMEEVSDEEEEEDDEEEDVEAEAKTVTRDADEAEDEPVAQKQDKDVDELAEKLGKTVQI